MYRSRATIPEQLMSFARKWRRFGGREQMEAQTFLGELLDIYDAHYPPGTLFEQHTVRVKHAPKKKNQNLLFAVDEVEYTAERMDMYIPKVCVWEMKGPEETDLGRHHEQVLRYWARMRPRYMVLCNFKEFWIYDTDEENGQNRPKVRFTIDELPEYADALLFLRGEVSHFPQRAERVTREMASRLGQMVREATHGNGGKGVDRERITKFALECVFAMFAEDTDLFPRGLFSRSLEEAGRAGSLGPVYDLFEDLGRPDTEGKVNRLAPYVNGSLYDRRQARITLSQEHIQVLHSAARDFDWRDVRPEIFGSIFEQALDPADRHELGAHFTREEDILKVVTPTVLEPWRRKIRAAKLPKDVEKVAEEMRLFHVLDPACGCGNFLYVVYREMKRLESAIKEQWHWAQRRAGARKWAIPPPPQGPYFTLRQLHGIEINPFASELARTVLWIGEHLAKVELDLDEETLPLKNLDEVIVCGDALLTEWPRPEGELAIVGNPPYLGVRKMRGELGDSYVENLFRLFPENRAADYVTYWFPKALATLRPGERAGFVTTNSIAQNESREASIDKVIEAGGTLTDVWKSYPWPGEAAVHVSIVNWVMEKHEGIRMLDGQEVSAITPRFTDAIDVTRARPIRMNEGLSFMGVTPGNKEFILDEEQRKAILAADRKSKKVIKPFLVGKDLSREVNQQPTRWVIDFGQLTKEEAQRFIGAFRYVQRHVYHSRRSDSDRGTEREKKNWWQFKRSRPGMREALKGKERYLGIPEVSPHVQFTFVNADVIPDHQVIVIVLPTSYHFGILQSAIHEQWALHKSSTLGEGLRYTSTTIFETFPFPRHPDGSYDPRMIPASKQGREVEKRARALYERRAALCKKLNLGLTKLYNQMKAGELPELQELHDSLNDAVNACYGWPEGTWRDENEVLARLLALNKELTHW